MRVTAVVLAAGASSRFGSPKLMASLAGRPVLQHVLDAIAEAGLEDVIVVLGDGHATAEAAMAWRHERRIVNGRPGDGLASSLRAGLRAAAENPRTEAVIVVLGDQPAIRPGTIEAVVHAAATSPHPYVRARYADDGAPNPVLVRREAWPDAEAIEGDRGLGPLLAARPAGVLEVPVDGANPDVDTPADLARLQPARAEASV